MKQYTPEEIAELVEKAKKQDQEALAKLLEIAEPSVHYHCLKFFKNRDLADDATQESLINIMLKLNSLQDPKYFLGWANKVAYHKCCDMRGSRAYGDMQLLSDSEAVFTDEESDLTGDEYQNIKSMDQETVPEEVLENQEVKKIILSMIDELPEQQRMAFIMFYYDDLSLKEISETLGISDNTIKAWLFRSRNKIRKSVEDYEKKNHIKLHSFSGLLLVPYIIKALSSEAAESGAAIAGKFTAGALSSAVAAGAGAGGTSATAATAAGSISAGAGAISGTASAVGGGLLASTAAKATAVILAVTVAGAGTVGGIMYAKGRQTTPPPMNSAPVEEKFPVIHEESSETEPMSTVTDESSEQEESILICDHEYILIFDKPATCSADGEQRYECSKCGESRVDVIPKIDHDFILTQTEGSTCSVHGTAYYECSRCREIYTESLPLDPTVHSYAQTEYIAPTCISEGHETYTCEGCGDSYTETLAADPVNGHVLNYNAANGSAYVAENYYPCIYCGNYFAGE